jgi:ankyrin repeat protein
MGDLHVAAYDADVELVRELLNSDHDPNAYDESGYTPLLWAAFRGAVGDQLPVILALIDAGADVNAITRTNQPENTSVLLCAIEAGNEGIVRALIERGADVNHGAAEVTPLMIAAQQGDMTIVRALLELGADPKRRAGRFTAADYARSRDHEELAKLLGALC